MPLFRHSTLAFLGAAMLVATMSHGCANLLDDGELGTPRVVGFVRGAPPDVQIYAPVSDRSGNVYLLSGRRNLPDVNVFVGRAGGGFSSGCRLTKGDSIGPIGWVGFSSASNGISSTGKDTSRIDRQWYWSGSALVSVSAFGDCRRVLDRDPSSGTDLFFQAVVPWVDDTPSKATLVALVRASADVLPFTVVVDLQANIYTTPRAFVPEDATDLVVHGTGANPKQREGWVLVSFKQGDETHTEARFYDENGALTARSRIDGAGEIPPYGVRGFMHGSDDGLVAGLLADGRLVLFDRAGGRVTTTRGIDPVGLHVWEGSLYVVGTAGGQPAVAAILDEGGVTAPIAWDSSRSLADALVPGLEVTDDRAPPRRTIRFDGPRAVGSFPLLTEHTSHRYADGETLIAIAGPTTGEGDGAFTLIAVAPAGITYP